MATHCKIGEIYRVSIYWNFSGEFFDPKKEPIYHPSNISEGSFYESPDPFEYMVTKAQQQTEEDLPDAHLSQQLEDLNVSDG